MRFARIHITYANVAATLALLLAMGGGALAATHYLITSTKQISPHVLSQLRGRRGPQGTRGKTGRQGGRGKTGKQGAPGKPGGPRGRRGPEGPAGPPGLVGVQGPVGFTGQPGKRGPEGGTGAAGPSGLSPLPSRQAESGVYGVSAGKEGGTAFEAVTFPVVLGSALAKEGVHYLYAGETSEECGGPGRATPGHLCIYSNYAKGEATAPQPVSRNIEGATPAEGSGAHGFVLEWPGAGKEAHDIGTYTVTEK